MFSRVPFYLIRPCHLDRLSDPGRGASLREVHAVVCREATSPREPMTRLARLWDVDETG